MIAFDRLFIRHNINDMMKSILFCFLLISSFNGQAQNSFLNHRNYIVVSGLGNIPMLSGSFNDTNYHFTNESMTKQRDWLDLGASFAYHHVFSDRMMLGFEINWRQYGVLSDRTLKSDFFSSVIGSYERTTDYRVENAQLNSWSILPIVSFIPPSSIIGDGIIHEIGLGYTKTSIRNKAYYYSSNEFSESEETWTTPDVYLLNTSWQPIHSLTFKYGATLSVPLSEHILIRFGMDSFINLYFKPDFISLTDKQIGFFNYEDIFYNMVRENAFTFNAKIGIAFSM